METDMIGIDSVEIMREKIKAKIKEEKMKNMESYLLAPAMNLTEDNAVKYLYDLKYKNDNAEDITDFEITFYESVVYDLMDLVHLCFIERCKVSTKEEVIDAYWDELVCGSACLDGVMTEDLIHHIDETYDTSIIIPCIQKYIKTVIDKTVVKFNK